MTEPVSATLGIKLSYALAGFFGGVVSLAFIQNLTPRQAYFSVLAGLGTAIYGTPAVVEYFGITQVGYQTGSAFVMGLCAMSILPAVRSFVERRGKEAENAAAQPKQGDGSAK